MKHWKHQPATDWSSHTSHLCYPLAGAKNETGSEVAESDYHHWIDQPNLLLEKRSASLYLLRLWIPVAGGPTLHDVGDVNLVTTQSGMREQFGQQLARRSNERQPRQVLLAARRLADQHDARMRVTVTEHEPRSPVCEATATAVTDMAPQLLERLEPKARVLLCP